MSQAGTRTRVGAYPDHMAPSTLTVLSVARTGSRVVRYLLRPAWKAARSRQRLAPWRLSRISGVRPHDPWAPLPPGRAPRPALPAPRPGRGRRAGELVRLVFQSLLGAVVGSLLLLLFGVLLALGIDPAGWLLGVTLLLALLGLIRTAVRGARLLAPPAGQEVARPAVPAALTLGDDEDSLLALLRTGERALPTPALPALHATVIATRDALRATADGPALDRSGFDARQAAREDLPELLRMYGSAPRSAAADRSLAEQLRLIERRMREVAHERQALQVRALDAQHRYLESKYGEKRD